MADHIKIREAEGKWVIHAGGAVLGESGNALELTEGDYPPVVYFPRSDVAMAFFYKTATCTVCPHKSEASYYSIIGKSLVIADAAWSYETPKAEVGRIAGHLAFYPNRATVERI